MNPIDISNVQTPQQCLAPQTLTGNGDTTNCTGVNLSRYHGVEFQISVGALGDSHSGSLKTDLIIEDSADNSTYAAVTDIDALVLPAGVSMETIASGILKAVDAAGDASQIYRVGYRGSKQYVRIALDRTGNHSSGTPYSVTALRVLRFAGSNGVAPS